MPENKKGTTASPLTRLAKLGVNFAHKVGLIKQKPSVLVSRLENFDRVFLGDDPWLTGGLPLAPKKEEGEPPRRFQYQPGYNIQIQPRSTEPISFHQLRAMSEYTLVRIVIERIKEAIKAHEWDIVPDDPSMLGQFEQEIAQVKNFFEKPDRRHDWDEWLGFILEDLLVVDAVSIFRQRDRMGRIIGYEPIDGATIKPIVDDRGFEPLPPAPAYQQFLYGVPYVNMTRDELIYKPRNRRPDRFYGFSPTEQIVIIINIGMRRELWDLALFTDSNVPAGLASVPKEWSPEEIKTFQDWFDNILSGDLQNRSKIKFVPEGFNYKKFKDDDLFGKDGKFDEWLARIICFAYGLSPQAFVQMMNRATAQEMGDNEAEYGLAAIKLFVERMMNDIIDHDFMLPHLRFNWETDRGRVVQKRVQRNTAYKDSGIITANEIRAEEGMPPHDDGDKLDGKGGASLGMGGGFTNPVAAPAAGPVVMQADLDDMVAENRELTQWAKFASNRFDKKRKEIGMFKCSSIPSLEAHQIRLELTKVSSLDALRHVFENRKRKVRTVRLPGPEAGDGQEFAADLQRVLAPILEREAMRVAGK